MEVRIRCASQAAYVTMRRSFVLRLIMDVLTRQGILEALTVHAETMKQKYSVRSVGVFGSFAHECAGADSDVDILVDMAEPTFDHYMDLKFFLEELFGRNVDLVLSDNVKPRLAAVIKREVIYAEGLQASA